MKNTHFKIPILSGKITVDELLEMRPEDFMTEEELNKLRETEEIINASRRTDWLKEQQVKGPRTKGFFKCKKCGS
jgi:hypothetical protein